MKKMTVFHWTDRCADTFQQIKVSLMSALLLAHTDFDQQLHLDIDGSFQERGYTLYKVVQGKQRVIAYVSRTLWKSERKISSSSKIKFLTLS